MEKGKVSTRIGEFDLWKFIMAIVIGLFHFGSSLPATDSTPLFPYGSIAVDFFFITSGFLMVKSAYKIKNCESIGKETLIFIKKKIKAFFPYFVFALLVAFVVDLVTTNFNLMFTIRKIGKLIVELLLIKNAGINYPTFLGTSWYLSVMILSMIILYPLILKYKTFFTRIVAPLIAAFVLGYLYMRFGDFRDPLAMGYFFMKGTLRGFAELSLGVFCYEICEWLKKFNYTLFSKILFTLIEYVGLIFVLYYSNKNYDQDPLCILVFAAAIIVAGGNFSVFAGVLGRSKLISLLGKFSLMFFLNHVTVYTVLGRLFQPLSYVYSTLIFLVASAILSIICWIVVDKFQALFQKNKQKFMKIFIK